MKQQQTQKAQAILPVKNIEMAAYFYDIYNTAPGEAVELKRTEPIGSLITGLRSYSKKPVKQTTPEGWIPVCVLFPESENSTAKNHFIYFKTEDIERINDVMRGFYKLYFHTYFSDLADLHKFKNGENAPADVTKKLLVDSFLIGLGLMDVTQAEERIKKRSYYMEVKKLEALRRKFVVRDYNFRKKIYQKRRKWTQVVASQHIK
jgi:hypothetical protein